MFGTHDLPLFIFSGILLNITPGADSLYIATRSVSQGIRAGGAAYLVYVGLSLLRTKSASSVPARAVPKATFRAIFAQGFLTNALNPKVALFFLAFVPQFIDPSTSGKVVAFLFLGGIFTFNGTLWCLFLAWFSVHLGTLNIGSRAVTWLRRSVGGLFVILGVRLALTEHG